MNISINPLSLKSVLSARDKLRFLAKDYEVKALEVCQELANISANVIQNRLTVSALTNQCEIPTVVVEPIDNGYRVKATGNDVLFLEFGTGITHKNSWGDENGVSVGSWSLSPQGKGHYAQPQGWFYYDKNGYPKMTKGIESTKAFWFAIKEVQAQAPEVVRKVLEK